VAIFNAGFNAGMRGILFSGLWTTDEAGRG
jgi:hypothetical protein